MKLYQVINNEDVLAKVIEMVDQAQHKLQVVEGEDDCHQVQPDSRYFQSLNEFCVRGGNVTRYYFGSPERFEAEKKKNASVCYIYGGGMENYQRTVIADGKAAMAKIGETFVYSCHPEWVAMLQAYLENG